MADCVYVTRGWGVHDERWTAALRTLGHDPFVISLDRDVDEAGLRASVASASASTSTSASGDTLPVLAGPLDSVTRHLTGIATRLVGLSWGFDLHALGASGELSWLASLNGLIVDSDATRAIAVGAGLPAERITFLPWGIDLDAFDPDGSRADLAGSIVLSLRAHEELYRVGDIVDAFRAVAEVVPDAVLVLGHSGSLTSVLRDRVEALGLTDRVHFIGTVDESTLAPMLRAASCYVTASSVDGTSVTLLQAMACGAPVVASSTPGNLGWIEPGVTGRIFATGDVAGLASVIIEALSDPDEASIARARELVVTNADWARNIERLERSLFGADASSRP